MQAASARHKKMLAKKHHRLLENTEKSMAPDAPRVVVDPATVIWQETFGNGIPEDWINTYEGGSGDATWQPGPPGYILTGIGLEDSYKWMGITSIQSDTSSNGCIYINSDALGEGTGPYVSTLITPTFDLTNESISCLSFFLYTYTFNDVFNIYYSINDGDTFDLIDTVINDAYESDFRKVTNPRTQYVFDLSDKIGGYSNVKLKFEYMHNWDYGIILDDIKLSRIILEPAAPLPVTNIFIRFFDNNDNNAYKFIPTTYTISGDEYTHYCLYDTIIDTKLFITETYTDSYADGCINYVTDTDDVNDKYALHQYFTNGVADIHIYVDSISTLYYNINTKTLLVLDGIHLPTPDSASNLNIPIGAYNVLNINALIYSSGDLGTKYNPVFTDKTKYSITQY